MLPGIYIFLNSGRRNQTDGAIILSESGVCFLSFLFSFRNGQRSVTASILPTFPVFRQYQYTGTRPYKYVGSCSDIKNLGRWSQDSLFFSLLWSGSIRPEQKKNRHTPGTQQHTPVPPRLKNQQGNDKCVSFGRNRENEK